MPKKRVEFIDLAKGIGILTVVWAHIMLVGWSHRLIYGFHMPFFFLASGLLFNRDRYSSFGEFLGHRSRGMLLPYAIYSVITWGIWALFRYLRHDAVKSYLAPLMQTIWAQGSGEFMVHNSALWFIPCLFAVEIMYFFISRMGDRKALITSFAIAAMGGLLAYLFGESYLMNLPWNLDAAFYALPFFCVADVFKRRRPLASLVQESKDNRFVAGGLLVGLTVVWVVLALSFAECSMGSSSYQCNIVVFFLRAFAGSGAVILFCILVEPFCGNAPLRVVSGSLKWCGRNSIHIMCMHIPIKGVVAIALVKAIKYKGDISESYICSAIIFVVTMLVIWLLVRGLEFCRRHIGPKR